MPEGRVKRLAEREWMEKRIIFFRRLFLLLQIRDVQGVVFATNLNGNLFTLFSVMVFIIGS